MEVRLILGDQLNSEHSWFDQVNSHVIYVMFEMRQETNYVKHHIQKVVAFFGAMRNFAKSKENEGHQLLYYTLEDPETFLLCPMTLNIFSPQETRWRIFLKAKRNG